MQPTKPKSNVRARPGGGFNRGLGQFDENLQEQDIKQATSQKQAAQQATSQQSSVAAGQGGGKAQQDLAQQQLAQQLGGQGFGGQGAGAGGQKSPTGAGKPSTPPAKKPRPIGGFKDELVRSAKDIASGLKSHFDLNEILGINPKQDTPEEQAKKRELHSRWKKLNEEDQAFARKKYQEEMQKKQHEEEEKARREQEEEQAKQQQPLAAPSGAKKGPVGMGGLSRKKRAETKLEQDRRGLGGAKGSN